MAIVAADGLTTTDRWVFTVLLTIADWGTAHLPDNFQPKSLAKFAAKCHVSARQLNYSLGHLQRHGWLERHRNITEKGVGGRGHPTRYMLLRGQDCDCKARSQCTVPAEKPGNQCTRNCAEASPVDAGQAPDRADEAVMGEERQGWALRLSPWQEEERWQLSNRSPSLRAIPASGPAHGAPATCATTR